MEIVKLLEELISLPKECEWVEFKLNNSDPQELGQNISALSNGACLHNQANGYLIFGVNDNTHEVDGTSFSLKSAKKGNEELENWLLQHLQPKIDFRIHEFNYKDKFICLLEIPAAVTSPVRFTNVSYIRIGSLTKKLNEFQDKEKVIWNKSLHSSFETEVAMKNVSPSDVIELIDTQGFFELLNKPYPTNRDGVLHQLNHEKMIRQNKDTIQITNLGAILFAKRLNTFDSHISRKAIRVIDYKGATKTEMLKDQIGTMGYAIGFRRLIEYINDRLPTNEEIVKALRKTVKMYPDIAIRELVANAIIHQDFSESGTSPIIEVFSNRVEITNPGKPLIRTMRFIDEYQSRNEKLASFMRRIGICEEVGSGIDKVIESIELFQLPAPEFEVTDIHTKVILFAYQKFRDMDKNDRIRACYQHCCLKYISKEKMTNTTLRERFGVDARNSAMISKIISDTVDTSLIKEDPSNTSKKYSKYIPIWA